MKHILYFFAFLLSITTVQGQRGYKHLNLDTGINIEGDNTYNLGLEFNSGDFDAWEIAVEVHLSDGIRNDSISLGFSDLIEKVTLQDGTVQDSIVGNEESFKQILVPKREEMFLAGLYYKPLLFKHKNMVFNFRYGMLVGINDGFVLGAGAGFEATYHFSNLLAIFLKQSNHYIINIDNRFRHSINAGIKIPF